jgi:hypothetical protein
MEEARQRAEDARNAETLSPLPPDALLSDASSSVEGPLHTLREGEEPNERLPRESRAQTATIPQLEDSERIAHSRERMETIPAPKRDVSGPYSKR